MSTLTGWPFWAPSDMEAVERALDLAEAGPGDHVVDLGCGDGQVLVAAARRGCSVAGVECDEDLARRARTALEENDLDGEVVLGDVFEFPLEGADVIFTYLAPATLQRLVGRFQAVPGTRLVTVDFEVPGLRADAVDGRNHLYELPAGILPGAAAGWAADGVLVAVAPDRHSLTCLSLHHPGGEVELDALDGLDEVVAVASGADSIASPGGAVAVDLRWEELQAGTFVAAALRASRVGDLPVFAFVTEEEDGLWEVTGEGVDRLRGHLATGWLPETFAELLAACDEDLG